LFSLTSNDMAKTTADEHQLLKTSELQSSIHGGRPKGSTKAKKKQDLSSASKCTNAIVLEYSRKTTILNLFDKRWNMGT
jgi:hypothetical protein